MTKALAVLLTTILLITSAEAKKYREWSENFEQMNVGSQWQGSLDHPDLTKIVRTSLRGGETKALEIKYLQNKFGNESRVRYKVSLVNADSYVLEFDLKFGKDFDFKKGGIHTSVYFSRIFFLKVIANFSQCFHQIRMTTTNRQANCGTYHKCNTITFKVRSIFRQKIATQANLLCFSSRDNYFASYFACELKLALNIKFVLSKHKTGFYSNWKQPQ